MPLPTYKFRLKVGSASYVDVFPTWDGQMKRNTEQGNEEMYFRTKYAGNFTFQREDYDRIANAAFDTEFRLQVQKKQTDGTFNNTTPLLRFWKTDCKFDQDAKHVEVEPEPFDAYDLFLGSINKEYDLIQLGVKTTAITYKKQAVLQIALPGADYIANFTDGIFWELPVASPLIGVTETDERTNHNSMLNTYGFGVYSPTANDYARTLIVGEGLTVDVSGVYDSISYLGDGFDQAIYQRLSDNAYTLQKKNLGSGNYRLEVTETTSGTVLYVGATVATAEIWLAPFHEGYELSYVSNPSEKIKAYVFRPYVRLLTDQETVGGTSTVLLPDDDPFPSGSFTRALPIETANFEYDATTQIAATRWPKVAENEPYNAGEYFIRPTVVGQTLMPVVSSEWTGAALWFYFDSSLRSTQESAGETITIKDAYKLADVLQTLSSEMTGGLVSHLESTNWSQFLYGTNDIRGTVEKFPVIVPKSNIIVGDYDQPAAKAPIKMAEILQLLRFFHNAFWHIAENKLHIEHYEYYHRGESYAANNVGADLTTLLEPKTGLPWATKANQYEYEKAELPERIEFRWMDRVSVPFEGYAIDIESAYVQKGNIQENTIARFTSDVDFINVQPTDITKEGFVFFECIDDGAGGLVVPFVSITIDDDEEYKLQNGYAANVWSHEQYHKYGLPAEDVTMNRQSTTALSVKRTKVQEIELALGSELDPYELVTTNLGTGRVQKIEEFLQNGDVKLTIKLDTE